MIQGSPEWHEARRGKVTASQIEAVMAKGRSGQPSATRANYMADLIIERLTGRVQDGFKSWDMERGNEVEPQARAVYSLNTGNKIEEVGFVDHPSIPNCGASPDGLIGLDGGLELKCPKAATHIKFIETGKIERGYRLQIQWNMACTGRDWWDYTTFHPDFPDELQCWIQRVERDDLEIVAIEREVRLFQSEMEDRLTALRRIRESLSSE